MKKQLTIEQKLRKIIREEVSRNIEASYVVETEHRETRTGTATFRSYRFYYGESAPKFNFTLPYKDGGKEFESELDILFDKIISLGKKYQYRGTL